MKYLLAIMISSWGIAGDNQEEPLPKKDWVEMPDVHIWITESHNLVIKMCGHFYLLDGEILIHRSDCGCKDAWWLAD